MALSVLSVWEVRTATGSDTNGGGWVTGASGTDWSQYATPQYALTNGTTAGTTTILTTSATADMVGNIAYVAGGTGSITGNWYQITAASVGTSITVDRSTGLTTGTGVTINVGGALATLTQAVTVAVQNNQIWCTGSQTITSVMILNLTSSSGTYPPFTITGYSSARGDGGRFTLQTATNSTNLISYSSANSYMLRNLLLKCTAGTPGYGIAAGTSGASYNLALDNCRITGFHIGIYGPYSGYYYILWLTLNNCEVDSCTSHGIENSAITHILNSYIHGNGGDGVRMDDPGQAFEHITALNSVFYSNTAYGINLYGNTGGVVQNCAFVSNATGFTHGSGSGGYGTVNVLNCIFDSNATAGIYNSAGITGVYYNNAFRNNGTDISNWPGVFVNPVSISASPFTNPTGGDFTLNSTSGAGAACKGAGFQSTLI